MYLDFEDFKRSFVRMKEDFHSGRRVIASQIQGLRGDLPQGSIVEVQQ